MMKRSRLRRKGRSGDLIRSFDPAAFGGRAQDKEEKNMDVDIKHVDKSQLKSFLSFDLLVLPKLVKLGFITAAAFMVLMAVLAPFYMAGAFMGFFSFGGFLHGLVTAVFLVAVGLPWL